MMYNFKEINTNAHIPLRFSNAVLGSYSTEIEREVKEFALKDKNDGVFLITGGVGTGKTTLLCGAIHERDMNCLCGGDYISCRMLCAKIRTSRSFQAKVNEEELYEFYSKSPFLAIDELGKAEDAEQERAFLTSILARRYDNMLPTLIATNLSANQVKDLILGQNKTGNDIVDRLKTTLTVRQLLGISNRERMCV